MQENNLQEALQSAYKRLHSTETALLKVQDHILRNLDQGKGVVLLLLDLSAAFDTVDHGLLLKTLETNLGIKGQCLQWLTSYIKHRQQYVSIGGFQSTSHTITCGVPQGSVLGPLLFTTYTLPLAALLRHHGIYFHLYADDTQLFLEFNVSDTVSVHEVVTMQAWGLCCFCAWLDAGKHAQAERGEDRPSYYSSQICTRVHFSNRCRRCHRPAIGVCTESGSYIWPCYVPSAACRQPLSQCLLPAALYRTYPTLSWRGQYQETCPRTCSVASGLLQQLVVWSTAGSDQQASESPECLR